ncbi:hypothetical protein SASPL_157075 [Salvia splendens]|uniref:mitogen-activated protein kinase kinase n=1 Tax=Salvia splendens TaxID=180675 RepID=A0A8X8VVJ0_SALSN|nr:hypothetical protein SASPL_157075 [Salvia splendens]
MYGLQVLGHGNGGTVYKVRHKQTSAVYALKVVHGDSDPAVAARSSARPPSSAAPTPPTSSSATASSTSPAATSPSRTLDPCNSYVGTCAYMSPERFDPDSFGSKNYDVYAGDIWSLGLTLLELYVGHFPAGLAEGTSGEFRSFVECCLQKDSSKRWTATQLLAHPFVSGVDLQSSA